MSRLILQGDMLTNKMVEAVCEQFSGVPRSKRGYVQIATDRFVALSDILKLREVLPIDINVLPEQFDPEAVKLVISDMDSTLIGIECIDEIADFADKKAEVSAITEAAMLGDLDFESSLIKRVALLQGLDVGVLERVFTERLTLNPGSAQLFAGLKSKNLPFALVSGGFTFFTQRLKAQLGFAYSRATELEIIDQKLTGKVLGDIVDARAKANYLQFLCNELGIKPECVVAIGDGANDLQMMSLAGLGVAYHAKPKVQAQADCTLNYSGLNGLLAFLDI